MMEIFIKPSTIFAKIAQSYIFKRVLNTPLQLYLFHALSLKKHEDKPYQYQYVQRFFSEYTYVKHIPHSLQLSQKQTKLKINSLTKNFFKLNIFAKYFPTALIVPSPYVFFDYSSSKELLLSLKELISIKNAPLNIDWLASFSSYKILIGLLQFNMKTRWNDFNSLLAFNYNTLRRLLINVWNVRK